LQNSGKTTKVNLDQYTTSILRELDDQISQAVLAAANPRTHDKIMELLWDRAKKRIFDLRLERVEAQEKKRKEQEEEDRFIEEMISRAKEEEARKNNKE
jgi:hypothetical protein